MNADRNLHLDYCNYTLSQLQYVLTRKYNNALMSWWEKFLQLIPSFDQPSPRRAIDRLRPPGRHMSLKLDTAWLFV